MQVIGKIIPIYTSTLIYMKRPAARAEHDLGAEIPHRSLICCAAVQSVVRLTNARNVQLHLSYNGMGNSEAEVEISGAFNTTVHLSFQVHLPTSLDFTIKRCLTRTHLSVCGGNLWCTYLLYLNANNMKRDEMSHQTLLSHILVDMKHCYDLY